MLFRPSFCTLLLALLVLGTPVKRDATQVESDINTVTAQSQELDLSIKAFPNNGATLEQALKIHQVATSLVSSTETAARDAKASPMFTDTQAATTINQIKALVPIVKEVCNDLKDKKPGVESVHAQEIAEADLESMKGAVISFRTELIPKLPTDMQSTGEGLFDEATTAIDGAITVYA